MANTIQEILAHPIGLLAALALLWFGGAAFLARAAGWAGLALRFPAGSALPEGTALRFTTGTLGSPSWPIRYRNCLKVVIGDQGLHVSLMFPFRFRSPAFLVPWDQIESVHEKQHFTNRTVTFRFRGQTAALALPGPAGQAAKAAKALADRSFVHARLIDAPREQVCDALRDPARLARWWGPAGFSNTFHEFDLRPGGNWRFVMHAPDGTDHPNESRFTEVVEPERVVIEHLSGHHFVMTIRLESRGHQTLVGWRQVFDTAEERARIAAFVTPANEQNLDRLAAEVARLSANPG